MEITFRRPTHGDCCSLFCWRIDPETARWSRNIKPTWEQHVAYFEEFMYNNNTGATAAWIALDKRGTPMGIASITINEVSVMVSPLYRRRGVATLLIKKLLSSLKEKTVEARILWGNTAGLKLFARCGFKPSNLEGDYLTMTWTRPGKAV